jgi:hypothetical protein
MLILFVHVYSLHFAKATESLFHNVMCVNKHFPYIIGTYLPTGCPIASTKTTCWEFSKLWISPAFKGGFFWFKKKLIYPGKLSCSKMLLLCILCGKLHDKHVLLNPRIFRALQVIQACLLGNPCTIWELCKFTALYILRRTSCRLYSREQCWTLKV